MCNYAVSVEFSPKKENVIETLFHLAASRLDSFNDPPPVWDIFAFQAVLLRDIEALNVSKVTQLV